LDSNVGVTIQKARRRVEHHLTRIGFGRSRKQIISREITPGKTKENTNKKLPIDFVGGNKKPQKENESGTVFFLFVWRVVSVFVLQHSKTAIPQQVGRDPRGGS